MLECSRYGKCVIAMRGMQIPKITPVTDPAHFKWHLLPELADLEAGQQNPNRRVGAITARARLEESR